MCVNTVTWDGAGTRLASGGDDGAVRRRARVCVVLRTLTRSARAHMTCVSMCACRCVYGIRLLHMRTRLSSQCAACTEPTCFSTHGQHMPRAYTHARTHARTDLPAPCGAHRQHRVRAVGGRLQRGCQLRPRPVRMVRQNGARMRVLRRRRRTAHAHVHARSVTDVRTGATLKTSRYHRGAVHKVAVHVDQPHVVLSCSQDGTVGMLDTRAPGDAMRAVAVWAMQGPRPGI